MKCPYCFSNGSKVLDKRDSVNNSTRRRRECLRCKKRFTTYERIEDVNIFIIKKDGRRERFDRDKLKRGLLKAFEKRPVSIEKVDMIVEKIESRIRKLKNKEVKSEKIGEIVISMIKKIDKVAYIRFASVYRSFEDPKDFEREVKRLR